MQFVPSPVVIFKVIGKILAFGISVVKASDFRVLTIKKDGKTPYYRPELIRGLLDDRNPPNPFSADRNGRFLGELIVRIPIFWALTTKTGKQVILPMTRPFASTWLRETTGRPRSPYS